MDDALIDSLSELLPRRLRPAPDGAHYEWVPWEEIKEQCTPRFREAHEEAYWQFVLQYEADHAAYVRRYIEVTARKYRARRRRRR